MHWMNPYGAWALISLAAILCLYILKQRMEPIEVSSTYLWRKAMASMEADRPFQRLRRSLLLLMQLLLALLLALSIMRPMTLGGEAGEVVLVFDLSASMQAADGDGTRLDKAVRDARLRLEGLPDGARVSILTAGAQAAQPLARSADMTAARRALEALEAQNGSADLEGALSLATALARELPDAQVVVYTDQSIEGSGFAQPSIGGGLQNRALLSLAATDTAAVARVANHGAAAQVRVECYADGELVDLRTVDIEAGGIASVQFDLPAPAGVVMAKIVESDALPADNARTWVSREASGTTVVLAGRDNVFLEKALSLRQDVQLLKTSATEAALVRAGALTVIDGPLPDPLPAQGALLLVDPDRYVGARQDTPATLSPAAGAVADGLNTHLQVDAIQIARYSPVVGGTPVWLANGEPVLAILDIDGRRAAVLGFDLHESNLPLLKEFSLFIQGLLDLLAPEPLGAGFDDGDCGTALSIQPQSFARSASVNTPSGRRIDIPLTGGTLADTNEIGVYALVQTDEAGEETRTPFTLHIPAAESDVQAVAQGHDQTAQPGRGTSYGREWTPWLVGLLLAAALLEWWVYRRGY